MATEIPEPHNDSTTLLTSRSTSLKAAIPIRNEKQQAKQHNPPNSRKPNPNNPATAISLCLKQDFPSPQKPRLSKDKQKGQNKTKPKSDDMVREGSLLKPKTKILKCRTCKGVGLNTISKNNSWKTGPCMICIGHGFVPKVLYDCNLCNNTGIIHTVSVIYDEDGGQDRMYETEM